MALISTVDCKCNLSYLVKGDTDSCVEECSDAPSPVSQSVRIHSVLEDIFYKLSLTVGESS